MSTTIYLMCIIHKLPRMLEANGRCPISEITGNLVEIAPGRLRNSSTAVITPTTRRWLSTGIGRFKGWRGRWRRKRRGRRRKCKIWGRRWRKKPRSWGNCTRKRWRRISTSWKIIRSISWKSRFDNSKFRLCRLRNRNWLKSWPKLLLKGNTNIREWILHRKWCIHGASWSSTSRSIDPNPVWGKTQILLFLPLNSTDAYFLYYLFVK